MCSKALPATVPRRDSMCSALEAAPPAVPPPAPGPGLMSLALLLLCLIPAFATACVATLTGTCGDTPQALLAYTLCALCGTFVGLVTAFLGWAVWAAWMLREDQAQRPCKPCA